ncbi:MAG TPA: hypothetical protein VEJ42_01410 [Streptosporangiaceae bacterium]|nr:hypothetical protein [Streptosporangiaceae bacterium]
MLSVTCAPSAEAAGDAEPVGDGDGEGDGDAEPDGDGEAIGDAEPLNAAEPSAAARARGDREAYGRAEAGVRSGPDSATCLAAAGILAMSLIIRAMITSTSMVMAVSTHIIPCCLRRRSSAGLRVSNPMPPG